MSQDILRQSGLYPWVLKTGRRSFLEATRRRLLNLFQLGLRWLRYALDRDQPPPCRLYLYPQ